MSIYTAQLLWQREAGAPAADFTANRYSRRHLLRFDGGLEVPASSSPQVVPLPWSDASAMDPEEAFVASLSSCHMLWFLSIAARRSFTVERYADAASGIMEKNSDGRLAMTLVTLRPEARFGGSLLPSHDDILALHHAAHEACFIANSVRTTVLCEPVLG